MPVVTYVADISALPTNAAKKAAHRTKIYEAAAMNGHETANKKVSPPLLFFLCHQSRTSFSRSTFPHCNRIYRLVSSHLTAERRGAHSISLCQPHIITSHIQISCCVIDVPVFIFFLVVVGAGGFVVAGIRVEIVVVVVAVPGGWSDFLVTTGNGPVNFDRCGWRSYIRRQRSVIVVRWRAVVLLLI